MIFVNMHSISMAMNPMTHTVSVVMDQVPVVNPAILDMAANPSTKILTVT